MATFEQIMSELKKGIYRPVYLLMGEEIYFIDEISKFIEKNALPKNLKDFNMVFLFGKEVSVSEVINTAKRFPMMAKRFVVFLKEAQHLKKIEDLNFYLTKPNNTTILVIEHKYKSLDKRTKLIKNIEKIGGAVLEAKKLYENQIPTWINNFVQEHNYSIEWQATALLTEYLGNDLSKIANELEKLFILYPEGSIITKEIISENIGISKDYNIFELQKALGEKNAIKAYKIAEHFAANPKNNPFVRTITSLYYYFTKLMKVNASTNKSKNYLAQLLNVHPFFVSEYINAARRYSMSKLIKIISILREYDLKAKKVNNVSTSDGQLLKELIYRIIH